MMNMYQHRNSDNQRRLSRKQCVEISENMSKFSASNLTYKHDRVIETIFNDIRKKMKRHDDDSAYKGLEGRDFLMMRQNSNVPAEKSKQLLLEAASKNCKKERLKKHFAILRLRHRITSSKIRKWGGVQTTWKST